MSANWYHLVFQLWLQLVLTKLIDSWLKSETSESVSTIEKLDLISAKDCCKIKVVTTRVRNKQDFILQGLFKSDLLGKVFLLLFYRLSFSFLTSGNWAQEFGPKLNIVLENNFVPRPYYFWPNPSLLDMELWRPR